MSEAKPPEALSATGTTTGQPLEVFSTEIVSDPQTSYIASSAEYGYQAFPRALSQSIDDVERDFGLGIYDQMDTHVYLGRPKAYLKTIALNDGLTIIPPFAKPDPKLATQAEMALWERGEEIAKFCQYAVECLEETDRTLYETVWEMLDAISHGHRLAEVTYGIRGRGKYAGKLVFDSIGPKPRECYSFVVNSHNRTLGVTGRVPGIGQGIITGILWDPAKLPNVVAREKLFVVRIGGKNGDPRGQSLYREAYDPWYRQQIIKAEEMKSAVQFAGGMADLELHPNANADGTDSTVKQMLRDASMMRNGAVFAHPNGSKLNVHRPSGSGNYFDTIFRRTNNEMITSMVIAARSIAEAEHGAKADTGNAQDVVDNIRDWLRHLLSASFRHTLRTIVRLNFGDDDAEQFTPVLNLSGPNRPDLPTVLTAASSAGYMIDRNQFPEWDRKFGIETPREEVDESQEGEDPQQGQASNDPQKRPQKMRFKRGGALQDK